MSELMTPIPFRELMTWVTAEYQNEGTVFGVHKPYKAGVKTLPIFGEKIETPFGPAADVEHKGVGVAQAVHLGHDLAGAPGLHVLLKGLGNIQFRGPLRPGRPGGLCIQHVRGL